MMVLLLYQILNTRILNKWVVSRQIIIKLYRQAQNLYISVFDFFLVSFFSWPERLWSDAAGLDGVLQVPGWLDEGTDALM